MPSDFTKMQGVEGNDGYFYTRTELKKMYSDLDPRNRSIQFLADQTGCNPRSLRGLSAVDKWVEFAKSEDNLKTQVAIKQQELMTSSNKINFLEQNVKTTGDMYNIVREIMDSPDFQEKVREVLNENIKTVKDLKILWDIFDRITNNYKESLGIKGMPNNVSFTQNNIVSADMISNDNVLADIFSAPEVVEVIEDGQD